MVSRSGCCGEDVVWRDVFSLKVAGMVSGTGQLSGFYVGDDVFGVQLKEEEKGEKRRVEGESKEGKKCK